MGRLGHPSLRQRLHTNTARAFAERLYGSDCWNHGLIWTSGGCLLAAVAEAANRKMPVALIEDNDGAWIHAAVMTSNTTTEDADQSGEPPEALIEAWAPEAVGLKILTADEAENLLTHDERKALFEMRRLLEPEGKLQGTRGRRPPPTIPMGDCFRWAAEEAQRLEASGAYPRVFVVHGIATPYTGDGYSHRYPHAWVEFGSGWADAQAQDWQRMMYNTPPVAIDTFYATMGVQRPKRFTVEESLKLRARTKHWGPW